MDMVTTKYIGKKPKLENPILIEGLPGIGNVGKLAVEHLIEKMNAVKFAEIYSRDFPPQVFINTDGTVKQKTCENNEKTWSCFQEK
jgi:proteasome assembly chaperone (PAC2) family protein